MTFAEAVKKYGGALAVLLIAIGAIVVAGNQIPAPTPAPTTTTQRPTTTSTTTTVKPGMVTLPVLQVPVDKLPISPQSGALAAAFVKPGDPHPEFGQNPAGTNYPISVVDARTANTTRRIFHKCLDAACSLGAFPQALKATTIAWNDQWRPPDGNDGFLVEYDPSTGRETDFWSIAWPGYQLPNNNSVGCWLVPGFNVNADICAATYLPIVDSGGNSVDVRTYTGNSPYASGGGIQNMAGLMSAADVLAGRCQAVKTMATNTTMGPTGAPAVSPAGQWERSNGLAAGAQQTYSDADSVPEGTRFVLHLTSTERAARLAKFTGQKRTFEDGLLHCLETTGLVITDTFGYGGAAMQFRYDYLDPDQYRKQGVDGTGADLIAGLFTPSNLVAVVPPTSTCVDGRVTQQWCWASSIGYR